MNNLRRHITSVFPPKRRTFKRLLLALTIGVPLLWWIFFALPDPLFTEPYSAVLLDKDGKLLNARIAGDEQWRFPEIDVVPEHFATALMTFEDKRFRHHIGVDVLALARAMRSNLRARRVVSGGSTLTMQVMRMARKSESRAIGQKLMEMVLALRAECRYSKDELLELYASHAPFGGNIVGLEAASWRYFGKSPELLSWAEASCLAVLPNSPALIHPGRGREILLQKRDGLILRLGELGFIDSVDVELALLEPLPDAPHPLPQLAPHLLAYLNNGNSARIQSTIDSRIQLEATNTLLSHHALLSQNGIQNGAILIMDTRTGNVLAYVGNVPDPDFRHENAVDLIQAERSSGSLLKPLLYASAFHAGDLLPQMLVPDIPTNIRGYQPENFTRDYLGMVPVDEALTRSLNVPAVLVLKDYGIERFRQELRVAGLSTITYSSEYYGLPLILGGAEIKLWDICGVYASMGRILSEAYPLGHRYNRGSLHGPRAIESPEPAARLQKDSELWDYGSLWVTLSSMRNLTRPGEDGSWETFSSQKPIAWKTGTSFGFRDAWAVGVTPDFTVGIWVGNADGEGRPELIGARAAAPVLFDVFRSLPGDAWWTAPYDALYSTQICRESGFLAGVDCPSQDSMLVPKNGLRARVCPFHQRIHTDVVGEYRYHADCAPVELRETQVFILPPTNAVYYKKHHPTYRNLPPIHPDCQQSRTAISDIELIYPPGNAKIYIPRELNGKSSQAVFQAAHRSSSAEMYWYLDNAFLGSTREFHTMEVQADPGKHEVIIIDESGERVTRRFEIVGT